MDLVECVATCVSEFKGLYQDTSIHGEPLRFDILVLASPMSVDQVSHLLRQFYDLCGVYPEGIHCQIFLYCCRAIAFVLQPGRNFVYNNFSEDYLSKDVMVILVGHTVVSTSGLRLNLRNWASAHWIQVIDRPLRVNNQMHADTVEVATTNKVIFLIKRNNYLPSCYCCANI